MNTKQIIDEMVRTLAARTWSADHKGTFVDFLDGVESVVNPAVRKLIESVAEEIIGKNIRHVTATMGDKDHTGDVDTDEVINALQDDIDAVNDYKEEQRLKVKEILSNLK